MKQIQRKHIVWLVIPLLMITFFVLYQESNYGISEWKLVKTGSLKIISPEFIPKIFINDKEQNLPNIRGNEQLFKKVPVGENSVVVSKKGFWPWMKKVVISEGSETIIKPFLIEIMQENIFSINKDSDEYKNIKNKIDNYSLPTKENKLVSFSAETSLWIENNNIFSENSEQKEPELIFKSNTIINNIDFYRNRDDVILFSTDGFIYALELDKTNNQNFQPLFQGANPRFIKKDNSNIYVMDSNILAIIKI